MNRILVGLLLLLFQDTLQVKVSLVSIGVRVTDSKGRSVSGLKAGDFSIFDEGVPQKIEFFSSEEQPITLGILLDHSSSMASNAKLDRAKEAALRLVQATHQASEYFYVAFDDNVQLASDFTTDREKVDSAIQGTRLGGGTSLYVRLSKAWHFATRRAGLASHSSSFPTVKTGIATTASSRSWKSSGNPRCRSTPLDISTHLTRSYIARPARQLS
jgi:VWFA-related protein